MPAVHEFGFTIVIAFVVDTAPYLQGNNAEHIYIPGQIG